MSTRRSGWAVGLCILSILLALSYVSNVWAAPHQNSVRQTVPPSPPTATPVPSPTSTPTPVPEVPEPSTLLLLASGLGALGGYGVLQRKKK